MGGHLLGWRTRCAVELDAYARRVLLARQADGSLPRFPVWDDVCTFDGRPWRGHIDVVSGGFPCQDISFAGRGAGLCGARSALWWEMHRIICEVGPQFVFVENVAALANRGLDAVLGSLADIGFDARWGVLSAAAVGAPHKRDRMWIVAQLADTDSAGLEGRDGQVVSECPGEWIAGQGGSQIPNADGKQLENRRKPASSQRCSWWCAEPDVGRVANGVAARVDRIRALGNGQVPEVARRAWEALVERHN